MQIPHSTPILAAQSRLGRARLTLGGLALVLASPAALAVAATPTPAASPQVRYQQESGRCSALTDHDQRANCLSRASTRLARSQPTPSGESAEALMRNALKRCDPLPEPTRGECQARIQGQGTVSGSVASGGMLRELVTIEMPPTAAGQPVPKP
jgi:hypothetical protein